MPSRSSSRPRADSFTAKLKKCDEAFNKMLDRIRVVNNDGCNNKDSSIWEIRKKVSNMCKQHDSSSNLKTTRNFGQNVEWPKQQTEEYNAYKVKDEAIGEAREAGRAAAKEADQCRKRGEALAVQERKLHHAIKQLERWADAAIATGVARLEFMAKYCPGAFEAKDANTGHLIAAESALLCVKNAVRKLEHEKRNLTALKKRQENILRAQLRPVRSCQAKRPVPQDGNVPIIGAYGADEAQRSSSTE